MAVCDRRSRHPPFAGRDESMGYYDESRAKNSLYTDGKDFAVDDPIRPSIKAEVVGIVKWK